MSKPTLFTIEKKQLLISIIVGLVLAVIWAGWFRQPATSVVSAGEGLVEVRAPQSLAEAFIKTVQNSENTWQEIAGSAVITYDLGSEGVQIVKQTFTIQQPWQGSISTQQFYADGNLMADIVWETDGKTITITDNANKTSQKQELPAGVFEAGPVLSDGQELDFIVPNRFGMMMTPPLGDYLFPTPLLLSRGGVMQYVGESRIAERSAYQMEWYIQPKEQPVQFWVDMETGIILKMIRPDGEKQSTTIELTRLEVK
jgi:hypothetical protein